MRPYSMDLRERVAAAIDAGEGSQRQVAKRFRVSVSFVTRLVQRRRDAGTLAPKPHGGGPRPALGFPERVRLAVRIAARNPLGSRRADGSRLWWPRFAASEFPSLGRFSRGRAFSRQCLQW